MTALITLTTAGADTGPYNLYSDVDGYLTPFETGITRSALLAGYTSTVVPLSTVTVRVVSNNLICNNHVDLTVVYPTTTTTSTTASPTTTTTTTLPAEVLILAYSGISGPDACVNYSLEDVITYYAAPGSIIQNGTTLFTDVDLTITAPNGYYSSGTNYYTVSFGDGLLESETACPPITTTTTTTLAATTTTTTTTAAPTTTTTTTSGVVVNTYLIEGIWEVDDPAHPAGGFINYINASGTPVNVSGLWIVDSFTITAQSIGTHAGVTITLIP